MTLPVIDQSLVIASLEWLFVGYFLFLHGSHMLLAAISVNNLRLRTESVAVKMLPRLSSGYEIPVSVLIPVSEATADLAQSVKSLFGLNYPQFEVIVIIDTDDGAVMSELQSEFDLVIFPEAYWRQVRARRVHNVYRSPKFPGLRVIDKKPGGFGDAINSGVNAARYPIVCVAHPDCVLSRDSLRRLIPDFLDDASTIVAAATERVANGSFIVNGFLERCRLAGNPLVWIQAAAGLRRDLCTRHGWTGLNAVLTVADRFCAFRKDAVGQAGGFSRAAVNPIVELLARLHRLNCEADKTYRIALLPAPVVWLLAPTTPAAICRQAGDEQSGLVQALKSNSDLLLAHNSGAVGNMALPFVKLTEVAGPVIEVLAWLFFLVGFALGAVSHHHLIAFAVCAAGLGILVSWLAILIDALVFRTYQRFGAYLLLMVFAIFENLGFRQVIAICRLRGYRLHRSVSTETKQ